MTVREEIIEIVHWYKDLPSDFMGINDLMFQRQRLVGFYAHFSVLVGQARGNWAESKSQYEKKKIQLRVKYMDKGTTNSNSISRANSVDLYEKQQYYEGVFYEMYYLMKACEEILSAMSQQIAHLREELKKLNFLNQ